MVLHDCSCSSMVWQPGLAGFSCRTGKKALANWIQTRNFLW